MKATRLRPSQGGKFFDPVGDPKNNTSLCRPVSDGGAWVYPDGSPLPRGLRFKPSDIAGIDVVVRDAVPVERARRDFSVVQEEPTWRRGTKPDGRSISLYQGVHLQQFIGHVCWTDMDEKMLASVERWLAGGPIPDRLLPF